MAKSKREKMREEYQAKKFYEVRTPVPNDYEAGGHSFALSYSLDNADQRPFQFKAVCPINNCGHVITADDTDLKRALIIIKSRIDGHVNFCHEDLAKKTED